MKNLKLIVAMMALIFKFIGLDAQVTIGSDSPPVQGALLQLKENDVLGANATRGMSIPRVRLSSQTNLFPMFEDPNNSNTPNSDYANSVYKEEQDLIHTGLVVYNINHCAPFGKGVFVWNGSEWVGVFNSPPDGYAPSTILTMIPDTVHIPSGYDNRPYNAAQFTFNYNVAGSMADPSWSGWQNNIQSGLSFTTGNILQPGNTSNPDSGGSWTSSPAVFSILPDKLPTSTAVIPTNAITERQPWFTKQSTITVNIPGNDCSPVPAAKSIVLNQTNYALSVKESDMANAVPSLLYTIRNYPDTKTIYVWGNSKWNISLSTSNNNVAVNDIVENINSMLGGQEKSDGTPSASTAVTITTANGGIGSKNNYASLTFSDPTGKAKDVVYNIMQCLGSLDTTGDNIVDATSTETSQPGNPWGNSVVRHAEKTSVYKKFYSAYFGNAGRWMITNVAASAYDGITVTPNLTVNDVLSTSIPYMVYPQESYADDLTNPSFYNQHPEYGYLYNYSAASGNNSAQNPQGICPQGWHLPSENDWQVLMAEIAANSNQYAINATTNVAAAMTNPCEEFAIGALGLSRPLNEGGFNIFLIGYAGDLGSGLDMQELGEASVFWTSTPYAGGPDMATFVFSNTTNASTLSYFKSTFFPIRCKKN